MTSSVLMTSAGKILSGLVYSYEIISFCLFQVMGRFKKILKIFHSSAPPSVSTGQILYKAFPYCIYFMKQ